jgi:hypothetical protein
MAELNNRKWLASEISDEYCQIILKRLNPNGFVKTNVRRDLSFFDNLADD